MGMHGRMNKHIMIYKGGEGECEMGGGKCCGMCKEGKEGCEEGEGECMEGKKECCKEGKEKCDPDSHREKMKMDTVIKKK